MSNYTMELRHMCEQLAGLTPEQLMFTDPAAVIAAARPHLFDFSYPLYDPTHKEELETKIIEHYYVREIGAETPGLFKLYLRRTMREIMPYFNELYRSAALEYNPLHDVDVTRTHEGTEDGSSSGTGSRAGNTSNNGTRNTQSAGTTGNTRTEARAVDETVNTEHEDDGTGTSSKTTHTETETDATGNTTGSKDSSASYTDDETNRNAFSATPESTIQGVEGVGGNVQNNVSADFWLTDYRKITDHKAGSSSAEEDTTGTSTDHSESTGDQTETGRTTDHKEGTGSTVTDRDESATITDAGTSADTVNETTTAAGTSAESSEHADEYEKTDEWTERTVGKQGSQTYAAMIMEFRAAIVNVDAMIIEALAPCFMSIY